MTDAPDPAFNTPLSLARQSAAAAAMNVNGTPASAAQAVNISNATGVPSLAINSNLPASKTAFRDKAAAALVNNNPQLGAYVTSHPLAATVSQNDLSNLDRASEALTATNQQGRGGYINRYYSNVARGIGQGAAEGFDLPGQEAADQKDLDQVNKTVDPYSPAGLLYHGAILPAIAAGRMAFQLPAAIIGAASKGLAAGIVSLSPVDPQTPDQDRIDQIGAHINADLSVALMGLGADASVEAPTMGAVKDAVKAKFLSPEVRAAAAKSLPYVDKGVDPPVGLSSVIDKIKASEVDADVERIKAAFNAGQKSETKDLVPDFYRSFAAQHVGEQTIGISADAIKNLYGEELPTPGDGKLGDFEGLADEVATSMKLGTDVRLPLADMYAKMSPEVFTQLEDGFRTRPGGMTKAEAAEPTPVAPDNTIPGTATAANTPDADAFSLASTVGLNKTDAERYQQKIAAQQEVENAAVLRRTAAAEAKRATPEWLENQRQMREKVSEEVDQQPWAMADKGIRSGQLPKIDSEALTPEEKAQLPRNYYGKDGVHPDDIADAVGYDSGEELVRDLSLLHEARGGANPDAYLDKYINLETANRMEAVHGSFEDNVLETAKELAVNKTQLDILHTELENFAGEHNLRKPISQDEMGRNVAKNVSQMRLRSVDSDGLLAAAFRTASKVQSALLKGDFVEAFKQRQLQWLQIAHAKEVMAVEKLKASFDKLAKKYTKRTIVGRSQEYTNQIHGLLQRLGLDAGQSPEDIRNNLAGDGYGSFESFLKSRSGMFRQLPVPDFLLDERWQGELENLTVEQFREVHDAIKALDHVSLDENTVLVAGKKADFDATFDKMRAVLEDVFPNPEKYDLGKSTGRIASMLREGKARVTAKGHLLLTLESVFNRFDRNDIYGIFHQTFVRMYSEAADYKDRLLSETKAELRKLTPPKDPNKAVINDLFRDETGMAFKMNRSNVMAVLHNFGNASNLKKLYEGYGITPEQVREFLFKNTTKADWDYAQGLGDVFKGLYDKGNVMSHHISGVGVEQLPLEPIETPFGTYRGWYHPLEKDPEQSVRTFDPSALEQRGYHGIAPSHRWDMQRTKGVYPLLLTTDMVPLRMSQLIHDIAMRPAVIQLSKFFNNERFMSMLQKYAGKNKADMMIPFLRDMANVENDKSAGETALHKVISTLTSNTVSTLIGMNPATIMKHGFSAGFNSLNEVGAVNWAREAATLFREDPASKMSNLSLALKADGIARRLHNFSDILAGQGIHLNITGRMSWRELAQYAGQAGVAGSDFITAVPTYLAAYKQALAEGADQGMAEYAGETAVRRAHGSSVFTNRAGIARGTNPLAQSFAVLYGFFSHVFQKQYEIGWRIKDASGKLSRGEIANAARDVPKIAGLITSYVLMQAAVEHVVSPTPEDKHASAAGEIAEGLVRSSTASIPIVRDMTSAAFYKRDPELTILDTSAKGVTDLYRDFTSHNQMTPLQQARAVKDMMTVTGYATGLTNAQEGKSLQFAMNYFHGKEHPQGLWQVLEGLRFGTLKGHTKSFEDWVRQEKNP